MSHTEYKVGYVAEIMELRGKTEHEMHEYFKCKGIIPDECFEEDGVYSDLEYECGNGLFAPVILKDGALIMYVISWDTGEYGSDMDIIVGRSKIEWIHDAFYDSFGIANPMFFAYSWYTGVDDPMYIDNKFRGE